MLVVWIGVFEVGICNELLDLKCILKIYLTRFSEFGWEKKGSHLDSKISCLNNYKSGRYYIITHFNHTHTLPLCISKGIFFPYCFIMFNIFIKYSVIIKVPRKLRAKSVKCRMLWILIFMLLCINILFQLFS